MMDSDVKDVCSSYLKRTAKPFPVILTPLDRQWMQALTLWVKDMVRVRRELSFDDGIMRPVFVQALMNTLFQETR